MHQTYLLTVLTFLPVAGTLALLLLRADDHVWIRRLAMITAVVEFGLSLLLLRGFDLHVAGYQWEEFHAWIPQPPIHYHLGVDGLSLFLVLLTTLLTAISILASWKSIDQRVKGFFICLLVLETGVIGVFVSLDLFLFFLFWEVMLIPMYFLIGIWGHERRIYAALKFVLYTMFGSILMLVAIIWLYRLTVAAGYPTLDVSQIQSLLTKRNGHTSAHDGNASVWRVFPGIRDQGAALPSSHLAAGRAHRSADRGLGDARGRTAENGHVRHAAVLLAAVS